MYSTFSAWLMTIRPKLLPASVMPVIVACALAYRDEMFLWIPAISALMFAIMAQIASNMANDYFDFKKGADRNDRLGPIRACSSGLIPPKQVLYAAISTLLLACACGSVLIWYGGWWMMAVGLMVCLAALAYTTGPFPLSYLGLGDLFVVLFYGLVPVIFTYYVMALTVTVPVAIAGICLGMVSTNILIVNNYRDVAADTISNKRTTIVRFGRRFGRRIYLFNGIVPLFICQIYWYYDMAGAALTPLPYLYIMLSTYKELCAFEDEQLNTVLFKTARSVLLFGTLLVIGLFI